MYKYTVILAYVSGDTRPAFSRQALGPLITKHCSVLRDSDKALGRNVCSHVIHLTLYSLFYETRYTIADSMDGLKLPTKCDIQS